MGHITLLRKIPAPKSDSYMFGKDFYWNSAITETLPDKVPRHAAKMKTIASNKLSTFSVIIWLVSFRREIKKENLGIEVIDIYDIDIYVKCIPSDIKTYH